MNILEKVSSFSLLLIFTLFSPANNAATDDEVIVLNFYPACDYEIIDSVTIENRLAPSRNAVDEQDVEKATQRIISRLKNAAQSKGADALILSDKQLNIVTINDRQLQNYRPPTHHTISYSAKLIKMCDSIATLSNNATPYDSQGKEQKSISLGSIGGWQTTIEFDLASQNKREITNIGELTVDLDEGAFGLQLNMPVSDVQTILGTPTFRLTADDEHLILAYGRGLWLVFKQGKLVSISSKQTWLSSEFINLLAFDERIDDYLWTAQGAYVQNESIEKKTVSNNAITYQNNDANLIIDVESFMGTSSDNRKMVVTHYTLQTAAYRSPNIALKQTPTKLVSHLDAYFQQEIDDINVESLDITPKAIAWISNSKTLHWYMGNLLVEKVGGGINKILMLESPTINSASSLPSSTESIRPWKINNITQFTTLDEALGQLGEDVFQMGDMIEITKPHYVQELIFYELSPSEKNTVAVEGALQLISSEITVY